MIESMILSGLIYNETFARKTLPFIREEYFSDNSDKIIYTSITEHINSYNTLPTKDTLLLVLGDKSLSDSVYKETEQKVKDLNFDQNTDLDWMVDQTEKFCQDKAIYNAVKESIMVLDGHNKNLDRGSIPQLLSDALAISFDPEVGHDFLQDFEKRYEFYHTKENKIPFDIEMLNKITKGGLSKKSLSVALASCVHPNTTISVRYRKNYSDWVQKDNFMIFQVKELLETGYQIKVNSPDGWVEIMTYVEKDPEIEHILQLENGTTVRCAPKHLFETTFGWEYAKDLAIEGNDRHFLTINGLVKGKVISTEFKIPIVDIMVDHPKHRYYTNGVSSHNTGVGKTLFMCHFAAANLMYGQNVLYITMEMSEERIAERIDANLLDLTLDDLREIPKATYVNKVNKLMSNSVGRLVIKEYPTSSANTNHFRFLLNELKLKKKFIPDVIYIDYLNICSSSRVKMSGSINSYTYIKSIAEELRGLAVEFNVPIFTATQSNRDGANNSDIDLTNTSESWGLPATADFMIALISTEELESMGQIMIKQLKNRWGDLSTHRKFVIGIDRSKMRIFDVDDPEGGLIDDTPVMSSSKFGSRDEFENNTIQFSPKKKKSKTFGEFT